MTVLERNLCRIWSNKVSICSESRFSWICKVSERFSFQKVRFWNYAFWTRFSGGKWTLINNARIFLKLGTEVDLEMLFPKLSCLFRSVEWLFQNPRSKIDTKIFGTGLRRNRMSDLKNFNFTDLRIVFSIYSSIFKSIQQEIKKF